MTKIPESPSKAPRIVFLDYLRVLACFMVIAVHSCEFFYISAQGTFSCQGNDCFWVTWIDSALRASVPLFVMTSSYLLLPLKEDTSVFFIRRFSKILIPFAIWSVLYAVIPYFKGECTAGQLSDNLIHLLWNFNGNSGHLWFIYMLIGLYLIMPILSPWLSKIGRKEELGFLALWFATTFYHYAKEFLGEMYGECPWNEFHAFWYVSGFAGYLVLAHYIRTRIHWNATKSLTIGAICFLTGYVITAVVFHQRSFLSDNISFVELSWRFCTPNVALAALGIFLMLKPLSHAHAPVYPLIRRLSQLSYGIYLMHIFVLNAYYHTWQGMFSTPLTILLLSVATFGTCAILTQLLSYLPGSRYITG